MLILGIESSCDETAVAVVENGSKVLASNITSQIEVHRKFGGVVPEVASREHLKNLEPLVALTLRQARCSLDDIDAIAVTQGPGLIGALLVGIAYAKGLALSLGKPLIPVDHVHAHIHGALLDDRLRGRMDELFPSLAMVVSGGHTNLYYMKSPVEFELLASTIDDACGECFDKVAKLLGLPYPGGPLIENMAKTGDPQRFAMPRMMEQGAKMAFSYSGLKTHMAQAIRRASSEELHDKQWRSDLCAAFQEEALGQIVRKLKIALKKRPLTRTVLIAGGVAANQKFREMLSDSISLEVLAPAPTFCSDNAAMIAALGYYICAAHREGVGGFTDLEWDAYSRYDFATYLTRDVEIVNPA